MSGPGNKNLTKKITMEMMISKMMIPHTNSNIIMVMDKEPKNIKKMLSIGQILFHYAYFLQESQYHLWY